MSIGKQMFQFQESKLLNEIAGLPNLLKARDLYNGKRFMNVPGAATPREAVVFKTTGICKPGVLSPDFAKALARAAMVEEGIACGAYGWNTEVCIGEWRCNPVFTKEGGDASVGELLNLAFVIRAAGQSMLPRLDSHLSFSPCGASFWRSATGLRMRLMIIAAKQMIRTRW